MPKFLKSVLIFILILFTFFIHPCLALGLVPVQPISYSSVLANSGPAEVMYSQQRLLAPAWRAALGDFSRSSATELWRTPCPLEKSTCCSHITSSSLIEITKKEIPSGSVLCLQDIQRLRTCVFLRKYLKNASHFCEPDFNRLTMATPQRTHTYGYNDIYELASSRVRGNLPHTDVHDGIPHDFTYDSVGNRTDVDGTTYAPNNLNQYESVGGTAYSYDGNGNLTNDGTNTYTYDVENRLSSVFGLQSSVYKYDAFGRRISKTVDGSTTCFIYDGDQVIEERGTGGLVSYTYGTGIDEVLTMQRDGETYYYFYDGLGSVSDITDSSGEVIESYQYDVYGQPNQVSTIGNPYYFTGRRLDEETGLYYYRSRYYSPSIGRFLQRDVWSWSPNDGRILSRKKNLTDILVSLMGIKLKTRSQRINLERVVYFWKLPDRFILLL